ncbi:MAG: hypothetical protein B6D39_07120 [Anaerolineae bacterium UTCFX2]|nr:AEC family transporter [Anaerolineales bacterium]OQY91438.1 MAG: hypothetical protein B6D39_07120 [Anaerolineae bacterium UTCFX2]
MNELFVILLNNLLPIFLIAGVGALLGSFTELNPRSLSQLVLYVFSPCLIFNLLTQSNIDNIVFLRVALFSFVLVLILGVITWIAGAALKFDRTLISSTVMATVFMNAGNYGLPVVLFAFGPEAVPIAGLFFVVNISLAYTAGTVIASLSSTDLKKATLNLLKLPLIYAVLLALLFINTGWRIPVPLARAAQLLGDAAIPCMIILLGLQLKSGNFRVQWAPIALIAGLRLVVSPVLAALILPHFGLFGQTGGTLALQAGMPTAVITTLLSTEYDANPAFASSAVFITTIISPLTITPLLTILGA